MEQQAFTFVANIQKPSGPGAFVAVPTEVGAAIGKKRFKVVASFDGVEYRGSVVTMGGQLILGVRKQIMDAIGKTFGDELSVELREDIAERVVELPEWLRAGLCADPLALATYEKLPYSHQREYVEYVLEAKKEETRARRLRKMISALKGEA